MEQNYDFLVDSIDLYCSLICDSRRSSRAGKVPLPGATSTAIASSGGAGGMSSSSGQGQDASSSSSVTAAGTASANGVPVPASIPSVPGDEHGVHHANVASGKNTILYNVRIVCLTCHWCQYIEQRDVSTKYIFLYCDYFC